MFRPDPASGVIHRRWGLTLSSPVLKEKIATVNTKKLRPATSCGLLDFLRRDSPRVSTQVSANCLTRVDSHTLSRKLEESVDLCLCCSYDDSHEVLQYRTRFMLFAVQYGIVKVPRVLSVVQLQTSSVLTFIILW